MTRPPERPRKLVSAYGCVECQEWHYEGDYEYEPHIFWQSKHGIQRVPERDCDAALESTP